MCSLIFVCSLASGGVEMVEEEAETSSRELFPASSSITTTAAADSSDVEKKIKDNFVKEMSKWIVKVLNPYRNPSMKGHISSTEDFKHLAKKVLLLL